MNIKYGSVSWQRRANGSRKIFRTALLTVLPAAWGTRILKAFELFLLVISIFGQMFVACSQNVGRSLSPGDLVSWHLVPKKMWKNLVLMEMNPRIHCWFPTKNIAKFGTDMHVLHVPLGTRSWIIQDLPTFFCTPFSRLDLIQNLTRSFRGFVRSTHGKDRSQNCQNCFWLVLQNSKTRFETNLWVSGIVGEVTFIAGFALSPKEDVFPHCPLGIWGLDSLWKLRSIIVDFFSFYRSEENKNSNSQVGSCSALPRRKAASRRTGWRTVDRDWKLASPVNKRWMDCPLTHHPGCIRFYTRPSETASWLLTSGQGHQKLSNEAT